MYQRVRLCANLLWFDLAWRANDFSVPFGPSRFRRWYRLFYSCTAPRGV